ncbi:MAG TPA: hypothetical protein VHL11_00925 [Phototrophicaceae bacterium]|jgi:hypothetical protein|nr:hypothetical protein [Phototrophicaceae bacterium]
MSHKIGWWKLLLFIAIALLPLFLIPEADKSSQILWMLVVYGGIALWLKGNQHDIWIAESISYPKKQALPPVEEFFDEDRLDHDHFDHARYELHQDETHTVDS